jgi:hypothetical protein
MFTIRPSNSQSRTAASHYSGSNEPFELDLAGGTGGDSDTAAILKKFAKPPEFDTEAGRIRKTVKVEIASQTSGASRETLQGGKNRGW